MISSVWKWLNERWPLASLFRVGLEEDIPGGASYAYTLGSATLIIFLLQIVSGVWQLFYYVPSADHAYNSLNYLRISVPFGWLIHGIHYWGAQAMIVLVSLHVLRVFIWGAYKRPRELTWLLGVVLLMATMVMSFTGSLLPWDEKGYFAAGVGTNIAGTVPVIGNWLKHLARGEESMGQLTLSRFFILHVAIIPASLMIFIGLHLVAFRKFGSVGPWSEAKRNRTSPFWPDQVFKDTVVGIILFLIIIALIVIYRPPITGPADPVDTTYQPKPEWNFLFLYQALKAFKGVWEPVGTVGLPLIGILLLIILPFLERRETRNPLKRPLTMVYGFAFVIGVIILTIIGYFSNPGGPQSMASSGPVGATAHLSPSAQQGAKLVHSSGCLGCHSINGTGGTVGPDLSNEIHKGRTKDWIIAQIREPRKHNPKTVMPAYTNISEQQVSDIVDYLLSLRMGKLSEGTVSIGTSSNATKTTSSSEGKTQVHPGEAAAADTGNDSSATASAGLDSPGPAADFIGNPKHGAALYRQRCEACHGSQGAGGVPNPGSTDGTVPQLNPIDRMLFNRDAEIFARNIDRFIQHGSIPDGPNPDLKMQNFGDSNTLTQQQIAQIEAYILKLNGVDRAQLRHPGLPPKDFLWITLAIFGLTVFGLSGFWMRQHFRKNLNRKNQN